MIKLSIRRGLGALKRRAQKVVRGVRLKRVKRVSDFGWIKESAPVFNQAGASIRLETDQSDWGYQLRSHSLRVPKGCWMVLKLQGRVLRGAVGVGFLDASGSNWLANQFLSTGEISQYLVVDPKGSRETSIVFSNAQGGGSLLELDVVALEWVPASLAGEMGNTESAIAAEIREVVAAAHPYPIEVGGGLPSPGNKLAGTGVYLRTDYWVKIKAGGSYGHTCYVAQELARVTERLVCFTPSHYELLDALGLKQVVMEAPFKTCNEIDVLRASRGYYDYLKGELSKIDAKYIYERSILGSYVGAWLSQELKIPYILEYNGSEISMKRSFDSRGYELEAAFLQAEQAAFAQATTIVAISDIIADGLIKQGIAAEKILVNPNGCSPDHYRPLDAAEKRGIRAALGWNESHCVIGFIGTFGGWHGIDVLADALPQIRARNPDIRFLLIGDGNFRHLIDDAIKKYRLADCVHMPGIVPQAEAGRLLACSDILVSPHSRHMVDSRFFGSPTKLFEYMALGGAIVASDLEQIGEVLDPSIRVSELASIPAAKVAGKRAVLCKPGDTDGFIDAVIGLAARRDLWPLLGTSARQALIDNYTWERHVEKIMRHVHERSTKMGVFT